MGFCFVHAADLHLDTPFEGLSVADPALRARLVDASLEALDALVDLALAEGALFVALAGDVYDGAVRGLRAQARLLEATRRLDAAGIATLIAHGNHDPVGEGWRAVRGWPARVHLFSAEVADTVHLTAADGTPVAVTGTSFPTRAVHVGLHARFPRMDAAPAAEGTTPFRVAVLHASVGTSAEHAPYSPCRLEDLVELGYDAWLLGHIHRRQVLRDRAPWVAYPGNLQGRSFKPSERGPKGALVVQVAGAVRGWRLRETFVPLAPVRFEEAAVDAAHCPDAGAVVDALVAAAQAWTTPEGHPRGGTASARPQRVVARARVTGRSAAYADLVGEEAAAELLAALRDRALPAVYWVDAHLDLSPDFDVTALRDRDDLQGALVREAEALTSGGAAVRLLLGVHPGLRELVPSLDATALDALTTQATHLALHLLGEGTV